MITSKQAKKQLKALRQSIIDQLRLLLTEKGKNDITFNETLVYNVINGDDGENESISGYKLGDVQKHDIIYTTFYGAEQGEYELKDMTDHQLIWMLEQIEKDAFEDAELND